MLMSLCFRELTSREAQLSRISPLNAASKARNLTQSSQGLQREIWLFLCVLCELCVRSYDLLASLRFATGIISFNAVCVGEKLHTFVSTKPAALLAAITSAWVASLTPLG